jgi:YfiH family protein
MLLFPHLEEVGLTCAVSTKPINVREAEDRDRFVAALGLDPARAVSARQIHRARVARLDSDHPPGVEPIGDALVTNVPGLPLLLRAADCSLVVIADPVHRAVGVAHAGWKGSVRGVLVNLIKSLHRNYGTKPSECLAAIGPTVTAPNYPVGPVVPTSFLRKREWATEYVYVTKGKFHFDLPGANAHFLRECGIPGKAIDLCELCTVDEEEMLHSFRRDGVEAGHHGMVAAWES